MKIPIPSRALASLLIAWITTPALDAKTFDLSTATIADIQAAMSAGALTSEKLVSLCLARIQAYEAALHAVIHLNSNALQVARSLDAERSSGKVRSALHGIPVVLKDNFDTTDLPTTGGFYGLKDSYPPTDATVAAQPDPRDDATRKAVGHLPPGTDYTRFLDPGALKGARIGVARDFFGHDPEVDTIMESALSAMKAQGAILVDIKYLPILLAMRAELYNAVRRPEFKAQIEQYLATLTQAGLPKTHAEILALSEKIRSVSPEGYHPNPGRLALYRSEANYSGLEDPAYRAAQTHGMAFVRETIQAIFTKEKLDAIVYPTNPKRPARIGEEPPSGSAERPSPTNFANLCGFPDLIVPAGFTAAGLPVGISFLGTAFSESRLLGLGYAYEQVTRNLRVPKHAPPLPGERFNY